MTNNNKTFFIQDIIFYNADFLKLNLEKTKVDLIITSPPYNIGIEYDGYDDNKTYREYLEFSEKWLTKCSELLKDGGRICVNVPIDTGKDGRHSLAADLTILAKRAGFKYKGTVIWNHSAVLGASKHTMVFSRNVELILIFYRDKWTPVRKEYKDWVNEIWCFSGESKKRINHPAPFPVELPRRLIKMFSNVNDVVMDPFLGSGTTLVASYLCRRRGIGVEISEKYFEVTRSRFLNKKW